MSDLRERVARALCSADAKKHGTVESVWKIYLPDADAAIAIVLEEAARVVLEQRCERGTPWDNACLDAAAAIRALAGKEKRTAAMDKLLETDG